MDQKFYKKMLSISNKYGFDFDIVNYSFIGDVVRFNIKNNDYNKFSCLNGILSKVKNIYYDSNYYTMSIIVMTDKNHKDQQRYDSSLIELVKTFYDSYRKNKNQDYAKEMQYKKAVEIGAIDVFNHIYK